MKNEDTDPKAPGQENEEFPGYPHQPPGEDIYNQEKEEIDIDPETLGKKPSPDDNDNIPGLDIPGVEADDAMEDVGSEDEENNYYSLGGDEHDDLEERNDNS
jgi:hypothetical protein